MSEEVQAMSVTEALGVLFARGGESVDELARQIAAKEAELDGIIKERKGEINSLKQAKFVIELRFSPDTAVNPFSPRGRKKAGTEVKPRKRATDQPQPSPQEERQAQAGGMIVPRRRAIAAYLSKHGPTMPSKLAEQCGIPSGSLHPVLDCDYFNRTAMGVRLTELGRRELLSE